MSFASRVQPHSDRSPIVPVAHRLVALLRTGIAILLPLVFAVLGTAVAGASGPHWVAGVNYFDPAAKGTPVVWAGGKLSYYIDQGTLSSLVNQSQAVTMLNTAAAVWTAVPTAAISISKGGQLSEDVNGSNVTADSPAGTGAVLPTDVQPTATTRPVGVIMDVDGSVINALYGPSASSATNCTQDGVYTQVDNMSTAGNIVHGLMILNGLCATTQAGVTLMQYQMVRAFGRLLGLDWSQVNDSMFPDHTTTEAQSGWPMMHPIEWLCSGQSYSCMTSPLVLRLDDVAGLNRLYPVTSANIGSFTGKTITASATISVQGTIQFKHGQGMQGVNVVLTPLTGGAPDVRYPVTAVSGVSFHSNAGNRVSGAVDAQGNSLNRFGTDDATMEGYFDLSGVPLPAGQTSANYQLTFEAVNPLYVNAESVGPYAYSQVTPSGTMPVISLTQLSAGSTVTENVVIEDSADETHTDDGTEATPNALQANGEWLARLTGYGHTGWFLMEARANRVMTVEANSLDQTGLGTVSKAGVLIGLWNGSDAIGSMPAVGTTEPFNGATVGLTTMNAQTVANGQVRIAFADMRGDGRPDYLFRARVLYADSVFPARLAPAGGPIVIKGIGFRANSIVTVNGVNAAVTSVTPTEITAVAPAANGTTGVVAVTVTDPATFGSASILDGLSYDAFGSDQIGIMHGPSGVISQDVPTPFIVQVKAADNVTPAANVAVTYSVHQGAAKLGCGAATCSVTTNGAGMATMMLSATSSQATQVMAALTNGASVLAEFSGSTAPVIAAVTPALYVAIGAQVSWQPTAIVLNGGSAASGAGVTWTATTAGISVQGASSSTNAAGQTSTTITAGPLAAGTTATVNACQASAPASCATFTVNAVHTETASLTGISGAGQNLAASATPVPVVLEVTDAVGHPLAGATVNFYETLSAWQPSCPVTGVCPARQTLATQTVTVASDANGMVTLTPLTGGGQPTSLMVNATTGLQSSLIFSIVQHP
jgi:hypothetical protein